MYITYLVTQMCYTADSAFPSCSARNDPTFMALVLQVRSSMFFVVAKENAFTLQDVVNFCSRSTSLVHEHRAYKMQTHNGQCPIKCTMKTWCSFELDPQFAMNKQSCHAG